MLTNLIIRIRSLEHGFALRQGGRTSGQLEVVKVE